jgi:hypothetical protein
MDGQAPAPGLRNAAGLKGGLVGFVLGLVGGLMLKGRRNPGDPGAE